MTIIPNLHRTPELEALITKFNSLLTTDTQVSVTDEKDQTFTTDQGYGYLTLQDNILTVDDESYSGQCLYDTSLAINISNVKSIYHVNL